MKIEKVETLPIDVFLFVHITTDTGLVGLGEVGLWGYVGANEAVIEAWKPYLIGKDPLLIEHHWQYLNRLGHFRDGAVTGALGGIDSALWDIAGQHFGVPAYQLLGGRCRDRIRVQTAVNADTVETVIATARAEVARGITALRITPFAPDFASQRHDAIMRGAVARVAALRETVGPDVDIGVEIHRRLSPADAVVMAHALAEFRPYYYEDPILPDSVQSCGDVARAISLPVATGERLKSLIEFRELLVAGGAHYVRIDPCLVGGLTPSKKIAALAESFHAGVMPHGVCSSVSTAMSVQIDACIPNFAVQDYLGDDTPPKSELLDEPLVLENGYLKVPDRPGIGVRLRADAAERFPRKPRPVVSALHEDGSVADR